MLNRIKHLMEFKELSSSQFADAMDVPRAVVSHILSGRNKPSLDVILKIAGTYNDVSLEWLLLGQGEMIASVDPIRSDKQIKYMVPEASSPDASAEMSQPENVVKVQKQEAAKIPLNTGNKYAREVKQVMIFYADGTFESYSEAK